MATIPFNFIKLALNYGIAVVLFDRLTAAVPSLRGSLSRRFLRSATGNNLLQQSGLKDSISHHNEIEVPHALQYNYQYVSYCGAP